MKKSKNLLLVCLLGLTLLSCGSDKENEASDVEVLPPNSSSPAPITTNPLNPNGPGNNRVNPWNSFNQGIDTVIAPRFRNDFQLHIGLTNNQIRPKIRGGRTIDLNDRRWTPIAVGDLTYQVQQTRQLPLERGMIVKTERIYFKKSQNYNQANIRCVTLHKSTMLVADMYNTHMINNNNNNEFIIDVRPECQGAVPMNTINGFYKRDINQYYEAYNINTILTQLSNIQVERFNGRNNQRFFKFTGNMRDQEFQQDLRYQFLIMLARGQYRVVLVKKFLNDGRLIDSSIMRYGFEQNQGRLNYNNNNVQPWNNNHGYGFNFGFGYRP